MNANELADAMEIRASIRRQATSRKSVQEGSNDRLADQLEQAANMIRQQQVEIDTLKYEKSSGVYEDEPQAEELFEIMKSNEMNNEPVAWMRTNKQWRKEISWIEKEGFDIPLYAHPAKTLTDDAKYNVTVKWDGKTTHHANVSLDTPLHYNEPKTLTDEEILSVIDECNLSFYQPQAYMPFARAILRKAQEK
jgi:hypothetical protein